jgi:hypothetical protein
MTPAIPWYITLIIVGTNLAIAVSLWRLLAGGVARSGLAASAIRRTRLGIGVFIVGWLGAALLLAPPPASLQGRDAFYLTPLIPLFSLSATVVLLVALWASHAVRRVLASAPLSAIHGIQLYRVIGATFLILLAQGQLPAHFALPAGWGDVAIGLTAPLIALALARRVNGALTAAVVWNVLGLVDLVVAVGMGTGYLAPLLAPGLGTQVPPSGAMGVFPLILVPTFAVPVSVMLHVLGLVRLTGESRIGARLVPTLAP